MDTQDVNTQIMASAEPSNGVPPLLRRSPDVVLVLAPDSTVLYTNPAVERVLGHPPHRFIGGKIEDHLHPDEMERVAEHMRGGRRGPEPLEVRLRHADGSWKRLQAIGVETTGEQHSGYKVYYLRDTSRSEALEEELVRRAFHDSLTGLANRELFMDRLDHALNRASRHIRHGSPVAVLFLDLDDFKLINDSVGHLSGDELLLNVGRRISSCLRPGDTAARMGGDEFAVLLDEGIDATSAARIAERMLEALSAPVIQSGEILSVSASIGVATSESGIEESEGLLRAADAAMYASKRRGRGGYALYGEEIAAGVSQRLRMESDLRRAISQNELKLYYQPQATLDTGKIAGLEALLRWESPGRGMVQPEDFMPFAERSGLILPIGLWALRESCRQAARWRERYPERGLRVSVNLSIRQLVQPTFVDEVRDTLLQTGLEPEGLVLEITESLSLDRTQYILQTLESIRELGVKVALDDFGAGHSSFSQLDWVPLDVLKIDRSTVSRLGHGKRRTEILTTSLMDLSHALGVTPIAEGVETEAQVMALRKMGCGLGQGNYFSRPLPEDEAASLLEQGKTGPPRGRS